MINSHKIKKAAIILSQTIEKERNKFLRILIPEIKRRQSKILAANVLDLKKAEADQLPASFLQRLVLDKAGINHLIKKINSIISLNSGLGEIMEKRTEAKKLVLEKIRVPLGILMVIYEARPEVTIDVASLCIKSGNAAILKGGSEALETNRVLFSCLQAALKKSGLPTDIIYFIDSRSRHLTNNLLTRSDLIDLVIARGGYQMVKAVMQLSKIPVLAHAAGGARIYIDKSANLKMAEKILVNAKITKPSACNSLDTILIHKDISEEFIPQITKAMTNKNVLVKNSMDWDQETLGLTVGIKVVKDVRQAVEFINQHTKLHSEGIVAHNKSVINYFTKSIDAAALFINASTRLHDGYVFGLGSEMGISTAKLHARGPVGLKELTTYKWQIYGHGNIR